MDLIYQVLPFLFSVDSVLNSSQIWLFVPEAPAYCLVMSYRQLENN